MHILSYPLITKSGLQPARVATLVVGVVFILLAAVMPVMPAFAAAPRWAGWTAVPGGGSTISAPSASEDLFDGLSVNVRGTDDGIYSNSYDFRKWASWSAVPGGRTPSAPSTLRTKITGPLFVFVRGTDNRIWFNRRANRNRWNGWTAIPGAGRTLDAPAAMIERNTRSLLVFVRGTDNGIYFNRTFDGTRWDGWKAVPGGGRTPSAPAVAVQPGLSSRSYRETVFIRGTNNAIWVNHYDGLWGRFYDPSKWDGWTQVPGGGRTPDAPAAVSDKDLTSQIVFVRGTDNGIYFNRTVNGRQWGGWKQVPGGRTTSAPAAVISGPTYLFVRGTDNRIWFTRNLSAF